MTDHPTSTPVHANAHKCDACRRSTVRSAAPTTVLLTGATGFLGHYVLAELLRCTDSCCRVLLRPPVSDGLTRLASLLDDLGIDCAAMRSAGRLIPVEGALPDGLCAESGTGVDLIVHVAGNTAFHCDARGEPVRTNVEGTRTMLDFADRTGIRRFALVSTAFVCGDLTGHLPESLYPDAPPFRNAYEQSKWTAETMVAEWAGRGLGAATILRPSILFGDSQSGRATSPAGLLLVARATEILARAAGSAPELDRRRIPLRILGSPHATCNVVPVDWAAGHIVRLACASTDPCDVYHITNPHPPTHAQVKQWLEQYFNIAGGTFCDGHQPLDHPNHYEDLFYSLGDICLDYFRSGTSFQSRCSAGVRRRQPLIDRDAFFRCLRHAQHNEWYRRRRSTRSSQPTNGHVSPTWYFERFLPAAVPRSRIASVHGLDAVVRYTITGTHSGSWVNRFCAGQLTESRSDSHATDTDFEYRLTYDDFQRIVTCRERIQDVFFRGGAQVLGNVERALQLVPIIGAFIQEFPVCDGLARSLIC